MCTSIMMRGPHNFALMNQQKRLGQRDVLLLLSKKKRKKKKSLDITYFDIFRMILYNFVDLGILKVMIIPFALIRELGCEIKSISSSDINKLKHMAKEKFIHS